MDGAKRTMTSQSRIVDHRAPHPHGCTSNHFGLQAEDLENVPCLPDKLLLKMRANLPMTLADRAEFNETVSQLRLAVIKKLQTKG